jgi:hypothetical protein
MKYASAFVGALAAVAVAATPVAPASAHGYRHGGGLVFGLAALGTAAVIGAAEIATAPLRVVAPPVYYARPAYYPPPPAYYYPPAPAYYYGPPPGYGYYGR